jgi:methanogen homocitrate synthase
MTDIKYFDKQLENGPWRSENYWVSQYNFDPEFIESVSLPKDIVIHDSTLRDGEQAPGVSFNYEQKIEIAKLLDAVGVQFIEAGFPAVSEMDRKSIEAISSMNLNSAITCLSRAMPKDIDLAIDCGVSAAIMELPIGYPRLKYQFEWEESEVLKRTLNALEYAEKKNMDIFLFMIDTARIRGGFLKEFITETTKNPIVKKISIVDTLGGATPHAISYLVKAVKQLTDIPVEVHCHNDFGLGTANTISGLTAGAESFACTVNGLGQRAGNTSLEEVVMALNVLYGIPNNLNISKLRELSQLVQELTQIKMPQYKSIVGEKVFDWEAGIPVAALRKLPSTVEPFSPDLVGGKRSIVLGKKSGKANVLFKLEELQESCPEELLGDVVEKIKQLAIKKNGPLTDSEFLDILTSVK